MKANRKTVGRPKAEKPLDIDCKVRIDAETAARLDKYCKRHDTRRALAIRAAILAMLDADEET